MSFSGSNDVLRIWRKLGLSHSATGPLTGLARIALAKGDLARVQTYVEEILSELDRGALIDIMEPFRAYLVCYRVLQANGDPRAEEMLSTAHRILQEQAAKIADEELRHWFVENMVSRREIVEAWSERAREGKY